MKKVESIENSSDTLIWNDWVDHPIIEPWWYIPTKKIFTDEGVAMYATYSHNKHCKFNRYCKGFGLTPEEAQKNSSDLRYKLDLAIRDLKRTK